MNEQSDALRGEPTGHTGSGQGAASVGSSDPDNTNPEPPADRSAGDSDREEQRRTSAEGFSREHDPAEHDIAAGHGFRQEGNWTADEAGQDAVGGVGDEPVGKDAGDLRVSALEDVRDGGFGVGSAAVLDNSTVPLSYPVKAWEDTKTFVTPDHPHYGDADPHVWFTDADGAEHTGFHHID